MLVPALLANGAVSLGLLVLALSALLFAILLWVQWRAERDGRADEDRRRQQEHRAWLRSMPLAGRILWYACWTALLAFMAWTLYRFDY